VAPIYTPNTSHLPIYCGLAHGLIANWPSCDTFRSITWWYRDRPAF